ncbi:MAG: DEAD/DEAH box helicase family protein [Actinomycetaceae bacterium]|nr:DEAD/DEAH box helicase family protein [Actinomycetaceae bacterium]
MTDAPPSSLPLQHLTFTGTLRSYQRTVLDEVTDEELHGGEDGNQAIHLVAPPGSGKTLLGLLLAVRAGSRALVLAPTTVIRDQWAAQAREYFSPTSGDDPQGSGVAPLISTDPDNLGDITIITYQRLSVVDKNNPFLDLARAEWLREVGVARSSEKIAEEWLVTLEKNNPDAYNEGLRKRAAALRKTMRSLDPDILKMTLHPGARECISALVAHGVRTIVLDECHHLLDHWALVVTLLRSEILQSGLTPLLIGLTATHPEPSTPGQVANYEGLLGDIDHEVPTPAVIRAGDLAPYRTWAWFTKPTREEMTFLNKHAGQLTGHIERIFDSEVGRDFLLCAVLGSEGGEGDAPPSSKEIDARIAGAMETDPYLTLAASRFLARQSPQTLTTFERAVVERLPDDGRPTVDDRLLLLARYALTRLLTDPQKRGQWEEIRSLLRPYGYHLTDRGLRKGRNPMEVTLSRSRAKEDAVIEILSLEQRYFGAGLKAAVVADLAEYNERTVLAEQEKRDNDLNRGGALRCFRVITAAPEVRGMHPVLITAKHCRLLADDQHLLEDLRAVVGAELPVTNPGEEILHVDTRGASSAAMVAALADLMEAGKVHLLVGTRGLLGEGWDCPSLNTVIDLTSVTTRTAVEQLHGRALRLDPAAPNKAAHNWIVVTVAGHNSGIDNTPELRRLSQKVEHLWGPSRVDFDKKSLNADQGAVFDNGVIVSGRDAVLDYRQQLVVDHLAGGYAEITPHEQRDPIGRLNTATIAGLVPRESVKRMWGTGPVGSQPHEETVLSKKPRFAFMSAHTPLVVLFGIVTAVTFVVMMGVYIFARNPRLLVVLPLRVILLLFLGGILLGALLVGMNTWRMLILSWKSRAFPAAVYRQAAHALLAAMQEAGVISAVIDPSSISVTESAYIHVSLNAGSEKERRLFQEALTELFTPISVGRPRHILEIGHVPEFSSKMLEMVDPLTNMTAEVVNWVVQGRHHYLAVPVVVGNKKVCAAAFQKAWNRAVGPATVIDTRSHPRAMEVLHAARTQNRGGSRTSARQRSHWV